MPLSYNHGIYFTMTESQRQTMLTGFGPCVGMGSPYHMLRVHKLRGHDRGREVCQMSIYLYLSIKGEGVKNFQNSVHNTILYLSQKGRGSPNVLMNYGCRICP